MSTADIGAALFMGLTWSAVLALTFYCFYKVLRDGDK